MKNSDINVKLASVLIDNLSRFDSRGYEKQGYHAVTFLGSIARHGYIPQEDFTAYMEDVIILNEESVWIRPETADRVDEFISLLRVHAVYQNDSTAQDIIDFPR